MRLKFFLLVALGLAAPCALAQDAPTLGEQLYTGRAGLLATLRGDSSPLQPEAVVCAGCHEPSMRPGGAPQALAPRLDARLADALPRRGGPARRYSEVAFCRLLRTGIDPASILVRRTMPKYQISVAECAALWDFVSRRAPPPEERP